MPAGRVLIVIAVALVTAMLLDSRGMVHTGEAMPPGGARDFVLDIAHPTDSLAHALRLDWPHEKLDQLLGRQQYTGPSDLTRASVDEDNQPVLGPQAQGSASPSASAPVRRAAADLRGGAAARAVHRGLDDARHRAAGHQPRDRNQDPQGRPGGASLHRACRPTVLRLVALRDEDRP